MPKILVGKVVSTKMQDTVVVQVSTTHRHKLYKKRIQRDKKLKVDSQRMSVKEGDMVKIQEIRPQSRDKHFKIKEIIS